MISATNETPREHGRRERRDSGRETRRDAVLWKTRGEAEFRMGWLLDTAHGGFAFACRAAAPPMVGDRIAAHITDDSLTKEPVVARVRRVQRVHADLVVVACSFGKEPTLMYLDVRAMVPTVAAHRPAARSA